MCVQLILSSVRVCMCVCEAGCFMCVGVCRRARVCLRVCVCLCVYVSGGDLFT